MAMCGGLPVEDGQGAPDVGQPAWLICQHPNLDIKKAERPGRPPLLDKLGDGHDVWLHPCGGDNIIICHTCWAYAARKLKGLANQCEGRRALADFEGRRTVKKRVVKGLRPSDGVKSDGPGIQYSAGM